MSETLATGIVMVAAAYLAVGLLFALLFAWRGAGRLDPAARQGTLGFRLLIVPGVAAFWPLLAWRWLGGRTSPPVERNAHRDRAQAVSAPDGER